MSPRLRKYPKGQELRPSGTKERILCLKLLDSDGDRIDNNGAGMRGIKLRSSDKDGSPLWVGS